MEADNKRRKDPNPEGGNKDKDKKNTKDGNSEGYALFRFLHSLVAVICSNRSPSSGSLWADFRVRACSFSSSLC